MPYSSLFPSTDFTSFMFFVKSAIKTYVSYYVRPKYSSYFSEEFVKETSEILGFIFKHNPVSLPNRSVYFTHEINNYICVAL